MHLEMSKYIVMDEKTVEMSRASDSAAFLITDLGVGFLEVCR